MHRDHPWALGAHGPLRPRRGRGQSPRGGVTRGQGHPTKSKKRDPGPDKGIFITEPLQKKVKPASTFEGEEDPWCHVHPDGNHLLKD